jgi:hypothetical protein
MTTICPNCKDAGCKVAEAQTAADKANRYGNAVAWRNCSVALEQAQSDCADPAAYRTNADMLARLADIEARQDRIEAMLRAKGWM